MNWELIFSQFNEYDVLGRRWAMELDWEQKLSPNYQLFEQRVVD